ncbi:MAG: hypothetical protein Fur0032_01820 [Terrimicrobiaceae bacterium]
MPATGEAQNTGGFQTVLFRLLCRRRPVYVASHERSGTHFAINTIFRNTYTHPRLTYVGDWLGPYDQPGTRTKHLDDFLQRWPGIRTGGGLIKTHADAKLFARHFPEAPVVYVVRDPRDTLVSFFHYLNNDELYRTNPGIADQRCRSFSEFLRRPASDYLRLGFFADPDFDNVVGRWASHVSGWIQRPGVCLVAYDDLKADFRGCIRKICRSCGLLPRWNQSPVGIGDAVSVLPRKGVSGDWRNVFSEEDLQFVRTEIGRRGLTLPAGNEPFRVSADSQL